MDKQGDLGDKLNNFCFHVYAQKSLIIGENHSKVFLAALQSYKSSCPWIERKCNFFFLTFQLSYQNKSCSECQQDVSKTERHANRHTDRKTDGQTDRKTFQLSF